MRAFYSFGIHTYTNKANNSTYTHIHTMTSSLVGSGLVTTMIVFGLVMALITDLATQAEAARAFFVFGDSLVDNGNNNYLATTARADAYPYGIDYPTRRPTGRFSNGLNIPDFISWVLLSLILLAVHVVVFYSFYFYF